MFPGRSIAEPASIRGRWGSLPTSQWVTTAGPCPACPLVARPRPGVPAAPRSALEPCIPAARRERRDIRRQEAATSVAMDRDVPPGECHRCAFTAGTGTLAAILSPAATAGTRGA